MPFSVFDLDSGEATDGKFSEMLEVAYNAISALSKMGIVYKYAGEEIKPAAIVKMMYGQIELIGKDLYQRSLQEGDEIAAMPSDHKKHLEKYFSHSGSYFKQN